MTLEAQITPPSKDNSRYHALDGLRAFAIIAVMLCHSGLHFSPLIFTPIPLPIENIFYNGWVGVDLFFVLSGFLIASQILGKPLTKNNVKNFCIRRFFRIAPAYYFSVLLFLYLSKILPAATQDGISASQWFLPYVMHLLFIQDYIPGGPLIDGVFWAIPIEMKFYLLCPFLIYFITKFVPENWRSLSAGGLFLGYVIIKHLIIYATYSDQTLPYSVYFPEVRFKFHYALDGLLVGFACAYFWRTPCIRNILNNQTLSNMMFLLGCVVLICLMLPYEIYQNDISPSAMALVQAALAISFCALVLSVLPDTRMARFLSNRILRFIADISYCLYLTHFMMYAMQDILYQKIFAISNHSGLAWTLSLPLYFGVTICFAYLLHVFIEKPCINWSKRKWR